MDTTPTLAICARCPPRGRQYALDGPARTDMSEWESWGRAGRTDPDDAYEIHPALAGAQQ